MLRSFSTVSRRSETSISAGAKCVVAMNRPSPRTSKWKRTPRRSSSARRETTPKLPDHLGARLKGRQQPIWRNDLRFRSNIIADLALRGAGAGRPKAATRTRRRLVLRARLRLVGIALHPSVGRDGVLPKVLFGSAAPFSHKVLADDVQ